MDVLVDGTRIYAATGGKPFDPKRRVIIFLHGAGMDHSYWPLQSRWFAWHGWSVLVPDLPGHGRSDGEPLASISDMAAWAESFMRAAGVDAATLVGHSMGGAIALEVAARLGARATGLALLGSAGAIPVHPEMLATSKANDPTAFDYMTVWGHSAGARIGRNATPGIWMTGAASALLARNRPGALHADLAACAAWTTGAAAAAKVTCPTLVLAGAEDIMIPAKKCMEFAKLIANATSVTLPRTGHMLMQEAPDATLDALIAHFGRT